jgi:hypothetical protein
MSAGAGGRKKKIEFIFSLKICKKIPLTLERLSKLHLFRRQFSALNEFSYF